MSSFDVSNGPIGLAKFAIIIAFVELTKYGEAFSTDYSPFLAVVFKSRFCVLSTKSLLSGNTSDRSLS